MTDTVVEEAPARPQSVRPPLPPWVRATLVPYLAAAALSVVAVTAILRLWRAVWSIPFAYGGDALGAAGIVKTTLLRGWYESQPDLGVPYGQHYHDIPFADDLHPLVVKVFGLFTSNWAVVFNLYYVLGYPLAAITGLWFLRRCGIRSWLAVPLAVLFSIAPYHLYRNEGHYFLGEYWAIPLGLGVALAVGRGEPIWGVRTTWPAFARDWPDGLRRVLGPVTGRGLATTLCLAITALDGAYYGVFLCVFLCGALLLAVVRDRDRRRAWGAVAAVATVLGVMLLAVLPDIIYTHLHPGADAMIRAQREAEVYAFKLSSLLLPAQGHPIHLLAELRSWYDTTYPVASEDPSLGFIGAIGFVFVMLAPFLFVARIRFRSSVGKDSSEGGERTAVVRHHRFDGTLIVLGFMCWAGFLAGTIGGFGTFISFFTASIRGWNRISIYLTLIGLAGTGVLIERRSFARFPASARRLAVPVLAVVVLLVGFVDQATARYVPSYQATAARYRSNVEFFDAVAAAVPHGSMIFQAPYVPFPEAGLGSFDNEQLAPYLTSNNGLRWSGGGFKGRPQVDWQGPLLKQPGAQLTKNLAIIGFAGVLVERDVTKDKGVALDAQLRPYTGPPVVVDPSGTWAFYSLLKVREQVEATMSPAERNAAASALVHFPMSVPTGS